MVIDRNSKAYRLGRFVGRLTLIGVGFILGKHWGRRPLNRFPPKN